MDIKHRFEKEPSEKIIFEENTELWLKHKTINLGCGFPEWETPAFVQKNLQLATTLPMENNYTQCSGHPELRKTLAEEYSKVYGTPLDQGKNIIVTEGGTGLLFLISFTYLEPNDEIVFFEPFFQYFEINAKIANAKSRYVELKPNNNGRWEVDFEELEKSINDKTKILIVNSPHNPTGKVFEKWELEKIAEIVKKFPKLIVIADEVYEKSVFVNDGVLPRFAALEGMFERTISVLSAGKTFHTTGWRIGYGIGPSSLIFPLVQAQKNMVFCTNRPCQLAVSLCYKEAGSYYEDFRNRLLKSRSLLISRLTTLFPAISIYPPEGGFFFIIDISALDSLIPKKYEGPLSYRFFRYLAEEIGVSMIPLISFYGKKEDGREMKEGLLRVSVCVGEEGVEKAIERMKKIKAE